MDHFTLDIDDIKACLELASDGINVHLQDEGKLDVIHKILYAVAEAAHNNQAAVVHLEGGEGCQFRVVIQQTLVQQKENK